jgi:hypothetical protein
MKYSTRSLLVSLAAVAAVTVSARVGAFPFLKSWHDPSDGNSQPNNVRAGGGGIYASGAAQDWGLKCSHCHIDNADQQGMISAMIDVSPPFDVVSGEQAYVPGARYTFTVDLVGEHLGTPGMNDNHNSLAVVAEDASGTRAGEYYTDSGVDSVVCPQVAPDKNDSTLRSTYVYGDCHGILATEQNDVATWTFDWEAPAAGTGDVTVFYGIVDGNTHADSSLDDDVTEGNIRLVEGS